MTPFAMPQNHEAEQALLAAVLLAPAELDEVSLQIRGEDFNTYAHQQVWDAMRSLRDAGQPIDAVSVAERLVRDGSSADAPPAMILKLQDMPVSGASAGYYAGLVREASSWRRLIRAGQAIADMGNHRTGPFAEALQEAERRIFELAEVGMRGTARPLAEIVQEACARIDARCDRGTGLAGLPSGLAGLDGIVGGLMPGELILLAARPSVGKTAMGVAIARSVAMQGHGVLFASLEQASVELAERSLASASGVNSHTIRTGSLVAEQVGRLLAARDGLASLPIHLDDTPSQSVLHIATNARRLARRPGGLSLVVIDYVQLIQPGDVRAKRHEQVGDISRRLKALARQMNVPVLALAQLNRGVEERAKQRPRLSDLRESGSLEQDADVVVLLHREDENPELLGVEVAKNRNGPTGAFRVRFDRARMRFVDSAGAAEESPFTGA